MRGAIHQINISQGGIPKRSIPEANVTVQGIQGDSWAHPRFHGGPNQALLLLSLEDIESLRQLDYCVYSGALGENLTTHGINMRDVRVADLFRAGEVLLQITKLRVPCRTLDSVKPGIQKHIYDTNPGTALWGRGGFYAKIIKPGVIRPGDGITKADPSAV
jgi:MOSC domain-containing protein YiiM